MIGIVSYGGYIPRLGLNRMSIYQQIGWLAPALIMVAQGERSMCNWDEDSLTMAVAASRDCLVGMDKKAVDALYLASTTLPFADRLNAGVVATALNLREDLRTADFSSSQRAGTTALVAAFDAVQNGKTALVTASDRRETRAASFYEMWFGDGAASLLLGGDGVIAELEGSYSVNHDFVGHYRGAQQRFDYTWEERWVRDQGYARIIPEAIKGLLSKLDLSIEQIAHLVYPCFIKREHANIARAIGASPDKVADNLHEVCGETGTAHPLLMLVHTLEDARPGERIVVASFGQGCDALCFQVTDQIEKLAPRSGIRGSLQNRQTTDNYCKFLKFRDLIETETGIRAEAPDQTAMTSLWRRRKTILGLVGGRCTVCGTPQIPKADICVNPDCGALHSQEEYEFADLPAIVKSFTGDMLAVSVDPPAIYGMVQFEAGGRLMADFTDCEMAELKVGMPVKMAFRRHHMDKERGFTGYFWKAIPQKVVTETEAKGEEEQRAQIRFDGQVAVVTGAGSGLGRVYALELAKRGAQVVVNDLGGSRDGSGASPTPADTVVQEIRDGGGLAVANYDSVASPEGGTRIVQTALDHFGRLDILINNAGILRDKSFAKMDPDMWHAVLDVHLQGAFNVTHPAFQVMRRQGYGRIILTTSAAGLFGNFGQTNYGTAKMALVGFMNSLKLEGQKYDIKVNTVAPLAATRLTRDVLPPDFLDRLKPEFVAPLVLYLASRQCSDSGLIVNAGMGHYSRTAIMSSAGIELGEEERIPELGEIHRNWSRIDDLKGAQEYPDANAALMGMLAGPKEAPAEAAGPALAAAEPGASTGPARVQEVFDRLPAAFQAGAATGVDIVFQFRISGPGGGDWYTVIKEGACTVGQGSHSSPTTTLKMSDEDFLRYVSGQLPAMQAYTSGRLKIEGDLMKSQLVEKLFRF